MASNLPGLENILDNLDVGIIIFDNKGTYLFVNKTLLQYTGRTRQDYLNHTVYDFIASGLYKESVVDKVYHEKRAVTQIHVTVSADGPEEYFYFIGKMYGLKKEEVDERLIPFERFMNGEVLGQKKFIRNFSAGNKQKIGIVSAMLHYPKLIILDEPFNFLDPSSQSVIKHLLKKYNEEHNATVIISSHNLNHTVDVCPRIAVLEHGVIIRDLVNENNSAEKELEDYFNVEEE